MKLPTLVITITINIGSPFESATYAFDCMIDAFDFVNIMYLRVIWATVMPIFYFLIFLALYLIAVRFKILPNKTISVIHTACIYLFIYILPNILFNIVKLISKRKISGIYWI